MQKAEDLQPHILPSFSSISMTTNTKEGRKQRGLDVVLRLPIELNRSHHSCVNTMQGSCTELQSAHVCSCAIKHAGVCSG